MNPKIWTPRYITNRIGLYVYEQLNKDKPWIAPSAIKWLDTNLHKEMSGVEFGSGRSTVWYAHKLKNLVSIEDHQDWYQKVKQQLEKAKLTNVRYILKSCEQDMSGHIPYVDIVKEFDNSSIDFMVVDGKHRDRIALEAIQKLTSGGFLLLDDAERYIPLDSHTPYNYKKEGKKQPEEWKAFSERTSNWEQLHFTSGVSDTVVLIKP
ncbi:class I SAM-dependent methyltransferase [uncultured Dokdonia sp.]|uniref:class I SAM-dependent methyltransferase n=1 Tax=uncultured Dokdonia sp. TaxID=575653 RepID=UPI00260F2045|nr:class I SAM-dependent methyltransferase [uncultured Dokdonia sp.]